MNRIFFTLLLSMVSLTSPATSPNDPNEDNSRGYIVNTGQQAPDFLIKTINNDTLRLSSLRGKVIMLQFTASWCGVCRKEMPIIESDIWQRWKMRPDFALYAIDREEPLSTILPFIKATGITYPVSFDANGSIFRLYAEKDAGITRNVIIDKTGKIVFLTRLYDKNEFNAMVGKINELLRQ